MLPNERAANEEVCVARCVSARWLCDKSETAWLGAQVWVSTRSCDRWRALWIVVRERTPSALYGMELWTGERVVCTVAYASPHEYCVVASEQQRLATRYE